ncbi:hypothetical protein [Amycolatopsis sp. NPDC059657]|uniref:hypothetical protein n=1 Tax=Amycolatopsis sp. NPDC059657 TaxID=3346899 RepID=UPI00366AB06F
MCGFTGCSFDGKEKSLLRHATAHVVPRSAQARLKASCPSTQDPADNLIDRHWAEQAIGLDPAATPSSVRRGVDRILDLYHWHDLYRPTFELT